MLMLERSGARRSVEKVGSIAELELDGRFRRNTFLEV